jgi:ABC-type sugar transport system ATPase subunit
VTVGALNSSPPTLLRASGLTVRYGPVTALAGADFLLRRGSVHAIVGENGAGKSTLMRVLSGALVPAAGTLQLDGVRVAFRSPRDAHHVGIRMIHQELSLVPDLSVAENIVLGSEPTRFGILDRTLMRRRARDVLATLGEDIDPDDVVGRLSLARREMVEIAKAIAASEAVGRLRVLILDEPTAILSARETDALFARIRALAASGVGVVYCSHRLEEIGAVADEVTVLRDGTHVGHGPTAEFTRDTLVQLMVGRPISRARRREAPAGRAPVEVLRVEGLSTPAVHDVSFSVGAGEIICLVGLVGAGRTELARAVIGADRRTSGEVMIDGTRLQPTSPRDAVRAGIGFVPEDRAHSALVARGSVRTNMTLARLLTFAHGPLVPVIDRERERDVAVSWVESLRIKVDNLEAPVTRLSGGNQQKVILARWLIEGAHPLRVLIVDEPTRGVDVGARADIYSVLRDLASRGTAILAITSDLEEALAIAERVLVMREGRIVGSLSGAARTAGDVAALMVPA